MDKRFSFFEDQSATNIVVEQPVYTPVNETQEVNKIRYRCEQLNATRIEDRIISHASTKKEYLVEKQPASNKANVTLVDYFYEIEPARLSIALDAMKEMEFIKETAEFRLNEDNEIEEVLNLTQMADKWNEHRMKLMGTEFYREIESRAPKAAQDILNAGDLEFKNQQNIKLSYDRVMLYHLLFNNYADINKVQVLKFLSQIFVNVPVEVVLTNKIKSQNNDTITVHTHGELVKEKLKMGDIEAQYDLYYKPAVKYAFTDYIYEYDIIRTIDKTSGNIIEANALLTEGVKNNYSTSTDCSLKQVRL